MGKFPGSPAAFAPLRASLLVSSPTTPSITASSSIQVRHATFIARARRPYTFTQLVQLSDGSHYLTRTTSPQPLYKTNKDSRNTLTWQPSEKSLRNVELDEAGKLAAFRERFGRGFDASAGAVAADADAGAGPAEAQDDAAFDDADLSNLIAGYAPQNTDSMKDSGGKRTPTKRK